MNSEVFQRIMNNFSFNLRAYLYNIQAINNIPSIIQHGLLSHNAAASIPHTNIAMQEVQDLRDQVTVFERPLHDYAALYFDAQNAMLYKRKDQNENICIMAFHKTVLDIEGAIVSDRNAASRDAQFYTPDVGLEKIDFDEIAHKYWTGGDENETRRKKAIHCAEVLVPDCIPFNYVLGAQVYSANAEKRLRDAGFKKQIIITPDFFYR